MQCILPSIIIENTYIVYIYIKKYILNFYCKSIIMVSISVYKFNNIIIDRISIHIYICILILINYIHKHNIIFTFQT